MWKKRSEKVFLKNPSDQIRNEIVVFSHVVHSNNKFCLLLNLFDVLILQQSSQLLTNFTMARPLEMGDDENSSVSSSDLEEDAVDELDSKIQEIVPSFSSKLENWISRITENKSLAKFTQRIFTHFLNLVKVWTRKTKIHPILRKLIFFFFFFPLRCWKWLFIGPGCQLSYGLEVQLLDRSTIS